MNFQVITEADFWVQFHLLAVLFATVLTILIFAQRKGSTGHKFLGRIWCVLMLAVAFGSFFIHELNPPNGFSAIHLLSIWTIFSVTMGWALARRHEIKAHRATMTGLTIGAIIVAGIFALQPGRLLNTFLFGM